MKPTKEVEEAMHTYEARHFWEAVVMAAVASGRKTAREAADMANELVLIYEKRWPPPEEPLKDR